MDVAGDDGTDKEGVAVNKRASAIVSVLFTVGVILFLTWLINLRPPLEPGPSPLPLPASPTATATVSSPLATPTLPPTATPVLVATATVVATATPQPTNTPTVTPTPETPPTATPTVTPEIRAGAFYTIKRGDTLWHIADVAYEGRGYRYYLICWANDLNPCWLIHSGNELWIPAEGLIE